MAIGTTSSSDSTPSSPIDPASAPVDPISTPVDYGLNSKGMPHTPYTAAYKWGGNLMGDGMSASKAAAACQTKFQVQIGKTTLQNGLNKGKGNTPKKPGRRTQLPEDAERQLYLVRTQHISLSAVGTPHIRLSFTVLKKLSLSSKTKANDS